MTFDELIATDPPRLVVEFQRGPNGDEQFKWGIVGEMPLLTLISAVVRAQIDMVVEKGFVDDRCDASALVFVYDKEHRDFKCFSNYDIPLDSILGMLETIKAVLVGSRLAVQAQQQRSPIMGLDGKPLRRM